MSDSKTEQFVRLLVAHEQDLYAYTFSLLPNYSDATDVMQEAAVGMWQHFDQYDSGRPFFPWASRFAYFAVLTFRNKVKHSRRFLSDQALEVLAEDYRQNQADLSPRLEALAVCLEKVPAPVRRLLEMRYEKGQTVQDIARRTGRSVHTLYKAFEKARHWLLDCINQTLADEGAA